MNNESYYPTTIFGVSLKNRDGWMICEWPRTYEEVIEELKENQDVLEVRKITKGTSSVRDEHGNPVENTAMSKHMALHFGWAYDPYSNCYRAPQEMLTQPPCEPKHASSCKIEISVPRSGWTDFTIQFDGEEALLRCSYVYDPFMDIVKWLEAISIGQSARVIINEEGSFTGVSVYIIDEELIRVVVHGYWEDMVVPLDHVVEKKIFINNVYAEIFKLISDKQLLYLQWAWDWRREKKPYPSLRSKKIEQYLVRAFSCEF